MVGKGSALQAYGPEFEVQKLSMVAQTFGEAKMVRQNPGAF